MYLYVEKRGDFSRVPAALLQQFGKPQWVMLFLLNGKKPLVNASVARVRQALADDGYYLQLPPPVENLLKTHRTQQR